MSLTLAFDVYGTLIDTHGVVSELEILIGDNAQSFSHTWREKQLEYSFRRGLMRTYVPFSDCIKRSLDYTCRFYQVDLSNEQKDQLLVCYRALPAFHDAEECLLTLKNRGYRLFAFSNGTADVVEGLLSTAGLREYFLGVISVDEIQSFKPNPDVYSHFVKRSEADPNHAWLISSNPFDVIGAISQGMSAAWVRRSQQAIFDPWEFVPTLTVDGLSELDVKLPG